MQELFVGSTASGAGPDRLRLLVVKPVTSPETAVLRRDILLFRHGNAEKENVPGVTQVTPAVAAHPHLTFCRGAGPYTQAQ